VAASSITGNELKYINIWRDISVALLGWSKGEKPCVRRAMVFDMCDE
jgi:hypothetical protein